MMEKLIILIDWSVFILCTGFFLGVGFGGAWMLWGLGKNHFTYNWPKQITLKAQPQDIQREEVKNDAEKIS